MDALATKQFAKSLSKDGFTVTLKLKPQCGCGGEFYIYLTTQKNTTVIFSNNRNKHPNAIIGNTISNRNYQSLLTKVKELTSQTN